MISSMQPFDAAGLVGDLAVTLDVDVLVGAYPDRDGPPGTPESVRALLTGHRIRAGAVASLRGALFDMRSSNDDLLTLTTSTSTATAHSPTSPSPSPAPSPDGDSPSDIGSDGAKSGAGGAAFVPVGALDLRDPVGAVSELERLAALSVRAVRLFPDEQGVEAGFPSVRHVARRAAEAGITVLTGGDVRRFWQPFSGWGGNVVFLDTHFYHLGDFLVAAADEPGFHTSTRLLNSPDALETIAAEVGVSRMLYGSRTPLYEPVVPLLRLATSGLDPDQVAAVAGGNARRLV